MKQIVVTLETLEIQTMEKTGDKASIIKVNLYSFLNKYAIDSTMKKQIYPIHVCLTFCLLSKLCRGSQY